MVTSQCSIWSCEPAVAFYGVLYRSRVKLSRAKNSDLFYGFYGAMVHSGALHSSPEVDQVLLMWCGHPGQATEGEGKYYLSATLFAHKYYA